ncbi:MAG: FliA/WhiG family RNA polymerase sigma factor [Negativicutes bacterium]|nr:FliA/WhiG family RNA polymerase sigma factor [Negativicutes bacterium]
MCVQNSSSTDRELLQLWQTYHEQKEPEAKAKLIEHYVPLVKLVSGRIAIGLPQYIDKDDLTSSGFFGLLDAIERFDPDRGFKFETYAVARIRGAILDSLRAQDWLPSSLRQKAKQYEQVVAQLESRLGRSAEDEEIASALGITTAQLHVLLNQLNASTLVPLDEFVRTETPNSEFINPTQRIEEDEVKEILAEAIDKLPEKERLVLSLYYYEGLTLKEISLIMKLSEARISQLHTKAIFRLRGSLSRLKSSLL